MSSFNSFNLESISCIFRATSNWGDTGEDAVLILKELTGDRCPANNDSSCGLNEKSGEMSPEVSMLQWTKAVPAPGMSV